jgi:membrane-associated phospholipid phosphatase
VGFCSIYSVTGAGLFGIPAPLPTLPIDRMIPFLDWTIWVYLSQFVFLFLSYAGVRTANGITRMAYSLSLASLLAFAIFLIYPTSIMRDGFDANGKAFQFLYAIDSSANCFPSLHVALAWLAALGVRDERRGLGTAFAMWAAAISLSTMTIKQHYFIDVIGGCLLAAFCRYVIRPWSN